MRNGYESRTVAHHDCLADSLQRSDPTRGTGRSASPEGIPVAFSMPSDADSADPPSVSNPEDPAHTYFHNSDPVALAEAANLGEGGPE